LTETTKHGQLQMLLFTWALDAGKNSFPLVDTLYIRYVKMAQHYLHFASLPRVN